LIPYISVFFIIFSPTMVFIYKAPANKRQKKPQVKLQLILMLFFCVFKAPANNLLKTMEAVNRCFTMGILFNDQFELISADFNHTTLKPMQGWAYLVNIFQG